MLANSNGAPTEGHPLGFTFQGCDIYSRIIHGTQASLMVGVFSVIAVLIIGVTLGALAGFFGGWVDTVIARLGDIFFALPIILGALVITQLPLLRENRGVGTVVLVLVVLGWPQMARITRGAVIEVRNADFVTAARSLGVSRVGIPGQPRAAERAGTDHRARHHGTRRLHRRRGHALVPRHRHARLRDVLGQ